MEICSYSQDYITNTHKTWISLIAFNEQMLRLREWPAIQERWAPICMVVTIKCHYTSFQMQLEICQSSSIHSTSSLHEVKPGLRRKMLLKKNKMQYLIRHAWLSLNIRPSEKHFKAVNVHIQPHTCSAWAQEPAWKHRCKTLCQDLLLKDRKANAES